MEGGLREKGGGGANPSQVRLDETSYGLWSHKKVLQEQCIYVFLHSTVNVVVAVVVAILSASLCLRVEVRFVEVTCPLLDGSGSKQLGCFYSCYYCSSATSLSLNLPLLNVICDLDSNMSY